MAIQPSASMPNRTTLSPLMCPEFFMLWANRPVLSYLAQSFSSPTCTALTNFMSRKICRTADVSSVSKSSTSKQIEPGKLSGCWLSSMVQISFCQSWTETVVLQAKSRHYQGGGHGADSSLQSFQLCTTCQWNTSAYPKHVTEFKSTKIALYGIKAGPAQVLQGPHSGNLNLA